MNKLLVGSLVVAALAGSAEAKVLIRYSFANVTNENGQVVVTNTAPDYLGKYTATVRSYDEKWDDNAKISWGATAAHMPVYSGDITNLCPHVDVQAGDTKQDHEMVGGALKWERDGMLGGLVIDDADEPLRLGVRTAANNNKPQFTIEALIRIPAEAASRSDQMLPILQIGNDKKRGFLFGVYMGRPFFRPCWTTKDGKTMSDGGNDGFRGLGNFFTLGTEIATLCDGRWHQIALTYLDSSAQSCARAFVDGAYVGANRWVDKTHSFNGFYYGNEGDNVPVIIGGQPYYDTTRTFWGEIAEIRITDTQITENRFIVPGAAGPVDDDTAVMLRFGENVTEGFGFEKFGVYLFKHDKDWNTYVSWNWNLRNAAYKNALHPRWYTYDADATNALQTSQMTTEGAAGTVLRADPMAAESFDDGHALGFAPRTYNSKEYCDIINIPDVWRLPEEDFTIELFAKTTSTVTRTFLSTPTGFLNKLCIHENKFLLRLHNKQGVSMGSLLTPETMNDGQWHQIAIVHRRLGDDGTNSVTRFYVDYKLIGQKVGALRFNSSRCFIGGCERDDQPFDGSVDNLRITRRALQVGEFLSARDFVSSKCLDATFDDEESPYASGQDPDLVPDARHVEEAGEVTLVNSRRGWVHEGPVETTERLREGGKAVKINGTYLAWKHTPTMERNALTFEFFAKFTHSHATDDTSLFRLTFGDAISNANACMATFRPASSDQPDRLVFQSATSSNEQNIGSTTSHVKICDMARETIFDSKWHHWAFAFEQVDTPTGDEGATKRQVRLTVYRDYEKIAGPGADGATYINGALTFPKSGSGCSFILGQIQGSGEENYVTATYDDVRVSPGILPVEKFLRFEKEPRGMKILVR